MPTPAIPMPNAHNTVPAPLLDEDAAGVADEEATQPPSGGAVPDTAMAGDGDTEAGVSAMVWSAGWVAGVWLETGARVTVACRGGLVAGVRFTGGWVDITPEDECWVGGGDVWGGEVAWVVGGMHIGSSGISLQFADALPAVQRPKPRITKTKATSK